MNSKRKTASEAEHRAKASRTLPSPQSKSEPVVAAAELSSALQALLDEVQSRRFDSREEAIAFVVSGIASKLEVEADRQEEMKDFLMLLIEMDPVLQEEINQAVSYRTK